MHSLFVPLSNTFFIRKQNGLKLQSGPSKVLYLKYFLYIFLQFLICTDVAARGLDVKGHLISKDIFFSINSSKLKDLPNLHRIDPEVKFFTFIIKRSETIVHVKYLLKLTIL